MTASCKTTTSKGSGRSSPLTSGIVYMSPPSYDNGSPESSGTGSHDSDSTIDIDDVTMVGGGPLERMLDIQTVENELRRMPLFQREYSDTSDSSASTSSSFVYDLEYEDLIDEIFEDDPAYLESSDPIIVDFTSPNSDADCIVVKSMHRTSTELFSILELNAPELRQDPWNPVPHILHAVERGPYVLLCMQRLFELDGLPFETVSHYIDFIRQTLEGLTFLHEHSLSNLSSTFQNPFEQGNFLVDIGPGIPIQNFDRSRFPVKYYYSNLRSIQKQKNSPAPSRSNSSSHLPRRGPVRPDSYAQDVVSCGIMISRLLASTRVPSISAKFSTLVKGMLSGTFTADGSRKLFEALAKSLDGSLFDVRVNAVHWNDMVADPDEDGHIYMPGLSRSRSHPTPLRRTTSSSSKAAFTTPASLGTSPANGGIPPTGGRHLPEGLRMTHVRDSSTTTLVPLTVLHTAAENPPLRPHIDDRMRAGKGRGQPSRPDRTNSMPV